MPEIIAKLRWNPGDSLVEIKEDDLRKIGGKHGAKISLERVERNKAVVVEGRILEDVWGVPFDEISQTVVTVSTDNQEAFRRAIRELVKMYRSPVTPWGLYGSSQEGEDIATEVIEEEDGW